METRFTEISFEEAKNILDNEKDCIILDVREESEFIQGHADGAELFPVDSINEESAEEIIGSKDTPVMTYCRTGSRSCLAAQRLCELGYKHVYSIGSLVGWPYGIVGGW